MPGGARGTRGSTQGGGLGQGRGRRESNLTCGNARCDEFGASAHLVDSVKDENPFAFLVPNHEQVFMARHEGKARHEGNEPMAYGALDTCGLGGGAFVLQGGCVGERHLSTKVEGQGSGQGRPRGHGGWWVRGSKLGFRRLG